MGDFFIARLFDRTIDFLGQSLNIRGARQGLLTSNIANAETPEYAAKDIPFQKILKQKLGENSGVHLEKTHTRHFPEPGVLPGRESGLPWELEKDPQGVNLDREMTKLAENNLMYQSAVQALAKKLETIKYIISEGGK
jgi:flagellar basal-body rod protein FlgB